LDVDSLEYLTLEHLVQAIDAPGAGFCDACLTGNYPVPVPVQLSERPALSAVSSGTQA
jgi:amidophosphoribosyltransferase